MRRFWKALPALAAATSLIPAAAGAAGPAPASDDVDVITPGYFTPVAEVPRGGVLGVTFTIRAVDARGTLAAGATVLMRAEGTGTTARLSYRDPGAGIELDSTFVVSMRFSPDGRGATLTGVGRNGGRPVSFTVRARTGAKGTAGTFGIALSNGYARSGLLNGRLLVG